MQKKIPVSVRRLRIVLFISSVISLGYAVFMYLAFTLSQTEYERAMIVAFYLSSVLFLGFLLSGLLLYRRQFGLLRLIPVLSVIFVVFYFPFGTLLGGLALYFYFIKPSRTFLRR